METNNYNSVSLTGKNYDAASLKRDLTHSVLTSSFHPTSFYQSTPKAKSATTRSPVSLMNGSITRSPAAISHGSPSSAGQRSASPLQSRSTSPTKLFHGTSMSPRQLSDVDADTIQKQRRELQLLITELKDRDRELNDMVHTHQKHLQSWDEDRQRILALERRCARLEGELKSRNEQCKALTARLKSIEADEISKQKELERTLDHLKEVTEQAEIASRQLDELEDKNTNLNDSLRGLSSNLGQLQAREQELLTKIKLKENDITEANIRIGEFQQKTRRLENALQEYQTVEKALRAERDQFRDQLTANKNEMESLRGEMNKQFSDADDLQSELAQSKQDALVLQKEVFLSGEREKRKDQLLELQKSKQERSDAELQNLRQICERQQRDISYMQMHLQTTQESFLRERTKDERLYDSSGPVSLHPEWLNMATDDARHSSNCNNLGVASKQGERSFQIEGEPSVDKRSLFSPSTNVARVFTSLSVKESEMDVNEPPSYFPEHGPLSAGNHEDAENLVREHRNIDSPEPTSDGEQFFQLPTFSIPQTFPLISHLESAAMTTNQTTNTIPLTTVQKYENNNASPSSKLHRLLAESRQMVQHLEQSTMSSPRSGSVGDSEKLSPSTSSPNTERLRTS